MTGLVIGVAVAALTFFTHRLGDIRYSLCLARAVRAGLSPYSGICSIPQGVAHDALPAALILLPFSFVSDMWATIVWNGLCFGLLAGSLVYHRGVWGLFALLSFPSFQNMWWVQWYPLITVATLIPAFLPLTVGKPHIAFAVGLWQYSHRGALMCASVILVTFLWWPTWFGEWIRQAPAYITTDHAFVPVLTFPGLVLCLLLFLFWKEKRTRLALLFCIIPIRGNYNLLPLFVLPQTWEEMVWLVAASWVSVIVIYFGGGWQLSMMVGNFAPIVVMLAVHKWQRRDEKR